MSESNAAPHIAYDDLREWLAATERLGELRHLKGASWQEDIGLAAEAVLRAEDGPCVLFDEVPGCPKGFRLLLNVFAGKRRNMTLGLPFLRTSVDHGTAYDIAGTGKADPSSLVAALALAARLAATVKTPLIPA